MEKNNAKNRTPKFSKKSQNCQFETRVGSLGSLSRISSKHGSNKIGASRKDRHKSDTVESRERKCGAIPGKVIDQLIDETEKQIAYYEQQTELLRDRLKELKQLPQIPSHIDKTA
nr:hypothetical protein [Nostoc sp. ZfuVER08]